MKNDEVTLLDKHFNLVYTSLPYTKVHCFEDCMLYHSVPIGFINQMTEEINNKIKELELPLIAKSNASNGIFKDTILIEPISKQDYE